MRVAIMQPTYLPWLGYFDLMDQVDVFVFLDDAEFSRQSWQQRNRVKGAAGLQWLTVPVRIKGRSHQSLRDTEIENGRFAQKHLRTLEVHYGRAGCFTAGIDWLRACLCGGDAWHSLVELNLTLIAALADSLGITTRTVLSSSLGVGARRGLRVAEICSALGSDDYLSPAGAAEYLREDLSAFAERGIRVSLQQYEHPIYQQLYPPFVAQASAIDVLLNCGPEAAQIMRSGRGNPAPLDAPARADDERNAS